MPLFQPGFTSTVSTSLTRMLCPLASWMVRWIFIFRVLPLYSSSRVHASRWSIGGSLRGPAARHCRLSALVVPSARAHHISLLYDANLADKSVRLSATAS